MKYLTHSIPIAEGESIVTFNVIDTEKKTCERVICPKVTEQMMRSYLEEKIKNE